MKRLLAPFLPVFWLIAYWYFCWASRDIPPAHEDVWEVLERRRYYADLLGFPDVAHNQNVPRWMPRHWNCRCATPKPLRPRPRLPQ